MTEHINFIHLSEEEKKLVLGWRNSPKISLYMHSKEISLQEHFDFIESLKGNQKKSYFLVRYDSKNIGVIYLIDDFLGLYANPDLKGIGKILLSEIINFAFETKKLLSLKAEVYKENEKAIKLYEKFGFMIIKEIENLLTMELKNENSSF